jgi:NitT/TauT family transport system permease protein
VIALRHRWVPALALLLLGGSFALPVGQSALGPLRWVSIAAPFVFAACGVFAALLALREPEMSIGQLLLFIALSAVAALAPLVLLALDSAALAGSTDWRPGFWCFAGGLLLLAGIGVRRLSALDAAPPGVVVARHLRVLCNYGTPLLFGAWVLVFWQLLTEAFDVPRVLLPAPSVIWQSLRHGGDVLAADFVQTVLHAALIGWAAGSALGFVVGVLIDRSAFLQRGLLPIAALASSVPLIGIAPIMVMWFGFDWHSKAAVVVIMTFFPMLVNTLAGLAQSGHMERDLMRSYGAGPLRTLVALRIPVALPFVFNALKINSTLAMIGAIVAEFFGSPVSGLGFRISTEAARLNMGLVWAAILVASVAGSLMYGLLGFIERRATFWHPSIRAAT